MEAARSKMVQTHFPSGARESEYVEINGKIEGCRRRWFENGQLFSETEFKDGMPHGRIREWSAEGVLVLSAEMRKGEFDGPYSSWWDSGQPKEKGNFVAGVRQPGYTWFHEDGTIWKQI